MEESAPSLRLRASYFHVGVPEEQSCAAISMMRNRWSRAKEEKVEVIAFAAPGRKPCGSSAHRFLIQRGRLIPYSLIEVKAFSLSLLLKFLIPFHSGKVS